MLRQPGSVALLAVLAGIVAWRLSRRRREARCQRQSLLAQRPIFYDRLSSNNAARVRLWLYQRGLEGWVQIRATSHEEQLDEAFLRVNPFGKIPALVLPDGRWLAEAAVILNYLEDAYQDDQSLWSASSLGAAVERLCGHALLLASGFPPEHERYVPDSPESRAHMRLVIRTHDLYISSPNCTQPGFSHTQGCMYLPPTGRRLVARGERAAKLRELLKQLHILESLLEGPFFCGEQQTLADLAVFPTLVFCRFLLPRAFGWSEAEVFGGRPKLRTWYEGAMGSQPAARRVRDELLDGLRAKEATGVLAAIRKETQDGRFQWRFPGGVYPGVELVPSGYDTMICNEERRVSPRKASNSSQ